jgi:hypothetical protein
VKAPNLSTVVTALRIAVSEQNEREKLRMLVRHYLPLRRDPHARWYLQLQLRRLRYLQPKGVRHV